MKIPESVQIGGHVIPVVRTHKLMGTSDAFGCFNLEEMTIYLDDRLTGTLAEETLIHEIIEAINCLYELNLEHRTIQTLGVALQQSLGGSKNGRSKKV